MVQLTNKAVPIAVDGGPFNFLRMVRQSTNRPDTARAARHLRLLTIPASVRT
jgi:hypothetical protein